MVPKKARAPASPFDQVEAGTLSKAEFRDREGDLRVELLEAQAALRKADFPVLIVLCGVDGAGKGETANLLLEWLDARGIVTCAYGPPTSEEEERPSHWRYWRDLPARGHIGIYLSAWYHHPLLGGVYGQLDEEELDRRLGWIRGFEQTLTEDGALILKLWMHLGKDEQEERLRSLQENPLSSWRVTETDWKHWRMYDRFIAVSERIILGTDAELTPWTILDGRASAWRSLRVGELIRDRIREHLDGANGGWNGRPEPNPDRQTKREGSLQTVDLDQELAKSEYARKLKGHQTLLNLLYRRAHAAGIPIVLVFEGWDASGKGGAIRRITKALDARGYRVIQIAAPTEEERAHHYLWRFWRQLPRAGHVAIFDRSWYGRVLVERVEGFASEAEWRQAYEEINEFEEQLVEHGTVLVKFWVHISRDEQERRFERRLSIPYKSWKLDHEDWRNRERWLDYEHAVEDMIERTGTEAAPWTLVEGNDKRFARVKVLQTLCDALERALGATPSDDA